MAKFKVSVSTNYVGSTVTDVIEIPDEDLEDLEGYERDKVIEEYATDWLWNEIDWGWEEIVAE